MMIQDKCAEVEVHTSFDEVSILFRHESMKGMFPYMPNTIGISYSTSFKKILEKHPEATTNTLKADAAIKMLMDGAELPENEVVTMIGLPCPVEWQSKEKQPTKFYYLFVPKDEIGNLQFGVWTGAEDKEGT